MDYWSTFPKCQLLLISWEKLFLGTQEEKSAWSNSIIQFLQIHPSGKFEMVHSNPSDKKKKLGLTCIKYWMLQDLFQVQNDKVHEMLNKDGDAFHPAQLPMPRFPNILPELE